MVSREETFLFVCDDGGFICWRYACCCCGARWCRYNLNNSTEYKIFANCLALFLQLRYYNALKISQYIYHGEFMIIMRSARNELMIIFRGYRIIIIVIINFIFSPPPHYDALSCCHWRWASADMKLNLNTWISAKCVHLSLAHHVNFNNNFKIKLMKE